jgi:hypothetical protein
MFMDRIKEISVEKIVRGQISYTKRFEILEQYEVEKIVKETLGFRF